MLFEAALLLFEAATMSNAAVLLVEAVVVIVWSSHDFECRGVTGRKGGSIV